MAAILRWWSTVSRKLRGRASASPIAPALGGSRALCAWWLFLLWLDWRIEERNLQKSTRELYKRRSEKGDVHFGRRAKRKRIGRLPSVIGRGMAGAGWNGPESTSALHWERVALAVCRLKHKPRGVIEALCTTFMGHEHWASWWSAEQALVISRRRGISNSVQIGHSPCHSLWGQKGDRVAY